jgi:hypothetical protein
VTVTLDLLPAYGLVLACFPLSYISREIHEIRPWRRTLEISRHTSYSPTAECRNDFRCYLLYSMRYFRGGILDQISDSRGGRY